MCLTYGENVINFDENQAGWNKAKQESLERDEFRCVLTDVGSELTTLETHHIIPYRVCKSTNHII